MIGILNFFLIGCVSGIIAGRMLRKENTLVQNIALGIVSELLCILLGIINFSSFSIVLGVVFTTLMSLLILFGMKFW